jgi:hypothetical protein
MNDAQDGEMVDPMASLSGVARLSGVRRFVRSCRPWQAALRRVAAIRCILSR